MSLYKQVEPEIIIGKELKKSFSKEIFSPVKLLLDNGHHASAVILLCCSIDYLAKYYSGNLENKNNKDIYIDFIRKYLRPRIHPYEFYKFIRSGLVHSYFLGDKYLIGVNQDDPHFVEIGAKQKIILINPWRLKGDIGIGLSRYLRDLETDEALYLNFLKVYDKIKLQNPIIDI